MPNYAGAGSHTISYVIVGQNGCFGQSVYQVEVHPEPQVNFTLFSNSVCSNDNPINLYGTPLGGVYTGTGISSTTFDPALSGTGGPFLLTYTYTDSFGCTSFDDALILVQSAPSLAFAGLAPSYCVNDDSVMLYGSPSAGLFLGTGVSGNYFHPSAANVGTHQIAYTYTSTSTGCSNSILKTTTVNPVTPISNLTLAATYCQNDDIDIIIGNPAGGVFSGPGMVGNVFDPSVAGSGGPYTVFYEYTNTFGCNSSYQQPVTVYGVPFANIQALPSSFCVYQTADTLVGIPAGGTFTGAGVSGNIFNSAQAGVGQHVIEYEVSNVNNCVARKQVTVVVEACVGVEEIYSDLSLDVYPNPFNNNLTIEWISGKNEQVNIAVRNILGQTVEALQIYAVPGLNKFLISEQVDFNKGIYFVEISNGYNTVTKKVVSLQ